MEDDQSFASDQAAAADLLDGYEYQHSRCQGYKAGSMTLIMSINNDRDLSTAVGNGWAKVVRNLNTDFAPEVKTAEFSIWGGADVEGGYSTPGRFTTWIQAYESTPGQPPFINSELSRWLRAVRQLSGRHRR